MELKIIKTNPENYEIKDYQNVLNYVAETINDRTQVIIQTNDDLKIVKENRTELNKLKKTLSTARIKLTEIMTKQFRNLEKIVTDGSEKLTNDIRAYEKNVLGKEDKPKTITLEVKSCDRELLEKIQKELTEKYGKELKEIKFRGEKDE